MTRNKPMIVAGAMSGTSADGIDVAITRVHPPGEWPRVELLAFEAFPFSRELREQVLANMNSECASVADLARMATRLGLAYADAIETTLQKHRLFAELAGCHGQTIYHQGLRAEFLGSDLATTWQLLDPAPIAERLRIPVVSDFRPADIAAGGQGAPLVPLLDYEIFRDARRHCVLQNLGGIGNMTVLPAGCSLAEIFAFDTGPANMVMDALMQQLFAADYDRDGAVAARGLPGSAVVEQHLDAPFFRLAPPKSAGHEQFGAIFAGQFLAACRRHSLRDQDAIATAALLTARSIALALQTIVRPRVPPGPINLILSGGGAHNATLVGMIREQVAALDCAVHFSDDYGIPSSAKEAVAFALLAWQTWNGLPGNVPSATGASRPVVLGRISHV